MQIQAFETEHFFAKYEFTTPHILSASDCETISVQELLQMAGTPLADLAGLELAYTESQGHPKLREAIAATYQGVSADEVVVLATPIEGIYLTMRTLLGRDDEVVVLTPAYDALNNLPGHISNNVRQWSLVPTPSGWQLDFSALDELLSDNTKLVIVNFPHNPTGFLPTIDEFTVLVERVQRSGARLFCDEMYRGLEFGQHPRLPSAAGLCEQSIVLSGLSKTYGLPGLRCGWLVIRDAALRNELITSWVIDGNQAHRHPQSVAERGLTMYERLITGLILVVGVIHLLPLSGFLGVDRLGSPYRIEIDDGNLEILMRHRAILFGILGGFCAYAAFIPAVQPIAFVAAFVSLSSFFFLAFSVAEFNDALLKIRM